MNLALNESGLPVRLRFDRPMTDEELMRFCAENETARVERDAKGELIVMSPPGSEGSGWTTEYHGLLNCVGRQDGRGKVFDSNGGFTLPDGSMRAPDAAWVSLRRWNALSRRAEDGFAPICPEFVIEVRSQATGWRIAGQDGDVDRQRGRGSLAHRPHREGRHHLPPRRPAENLAHPTSVQGTGPIAGFELVMARIWN